MPHFFALAWTYRKDYAAAHFPILSVVDPSGRRVSRRAFFWTVLVAVERACRRCWGIAPWYYYLALADRLLGLWILKSAFTFLNPEKRETEARRLFLISIGLPAAAARLRWWPDRLLFRLFNRRSAANMSINVHSNLTLNAALNATATVLTARSASSSSNGAR